MAESIALIGLGYVGLPLAVALAKKHPSVIGYDISKSRIEELNHGTDSTLEVDPELLKASSATFTSELSAIQDCTFYIITVPTPVDLNNQPDLRPVESASRMVGKLLKKGDIVVYESTVYPGVTEDFCGPILEQESGLKQGKDFKLGYSPERVNPGDKEHTIEKIVKVVSAEDAESLERVSGVYGPVITAGIHRASSIKVAEAAKVIENTQRDVNIALMNELSLIFDRMGIRTIDVLEAAGTKWNFLKFRPGLVGGHCIGVDPYYLTMRALQLGYHPQVILSGRRINDNMGAFIANKVVKLMVESELPIKGAKVGVLGLTFKENVPDLRNSRVPDILAELESFGIRPIVHDPGADSEEAMHEYGRTLTSLDEFHDLDALIVAVIHREYLQMGPQKLMTMLKPNAIFVDVKSAFNPGDVPAGVRYWSL